MRKVKVSINYETATLTIKHNGQKVLILCTYLQDDTKWRYADKDNVVEKEVEEKDGQEESKEEDIMAYLNSSHTYLFSEKEKFSHQKRTIAKIQNTTKATANKTTELSNLP